MSELPSCIHCYPAANNHLPNKLGSMVDFYLGLPLGLLSKGLLPKSLRREAPKFIQKSLFIFSETIKQLTLTDKIDRTRFNNNILVLWDEAQQRKLELFNLSFLEQPTQYFAFTWKEKKYYFDRSPIYLLAKNFNHYAKASTYDDKATLKKFLLKHNLPCPQGKAFISTRKALLYGKNLGFPLLVKPACSSLSRHVSFNVQTEEALLKAIKLSKQIDYRVMVEQYIAGAVYRALVIDKSLVACLKRQPGCIIGNGKDSVESLIHQKNQLASRGEPMQRNTTLHKTEITKELVKILTSQGVHLTTALKKGQRILLSNKINSGNGADTSNVTESCHPENKELFERAHRLLNIPLSGLDFICKDISIPWHQQAFAIIENNSLPYLDLHHFPAEGESINVAAKVWDFVLGSL